MMVRSLSQRRAFPYFLARGLKLLVLDVDGVLTDGGLYYDDSGLAIKRFNVQDGLGIKTARRFGLETAIITGMHSEAARQRASDLVISEYHSGILDKISCLEDMRQRLSLEWDEIAYMGDDWLDLAPMRKVGLPLSVPNGRAAVRREARYVTDARGGEGAVREVIERILSAKGTLEGALAEFYGQTK